MKKKLVNRLKKWGEAELRATQSNESPHCGEQFGVNRSPDVVLGPRLNNKSEKKKLSPI